MKCPKCGSQKAKYIEKRDKHDRKKKPRINFHAKCSTCKFEFNAQEYYDVVSEMEEKVEKKTVIKMKYTEDEK